MLYVVCLGLGVHDSWRLVKCQDHAGRMLSKLKGNLRVSKSSSTLLPSMMADTLLKVSEQLLHKIKANRRREMFASCSHEAAF